jgi:hypothetical protein
LKKKEKEGPRHEPIQRPRIQTSWLPIKLYFQRQRYTYPGMRFFSALVAELRFSGITPIEINVTPIWTCFKVGINIKLVTA